MLTAISTLRFFCLVEGLSLLLLLGVAMPLKYYADLPQAVRYVGMAHGILWLVVCGLIAGVTFRHRWHFGRSALVLVSSLLPFGFACLDQRMRRWSTEGTTAK